MLKLNPTPIIISLLILFLLIGSVVLYSKNKSLNSEIKALSVRLDAANASIDTIKQDMVNREMLSLIVKENRYDRDDKITVIREEIKQVDNVVKSPVEASIKINIDFNKDLDELIKVTK